MEFSKDIQDLLATRYPGKDIYSMSLDELKSFREEVENLREEYSLIELGYKLISNSLYGASANVFFYFYNLALAGDITGECRELTKWMWNRMELFFHEDIWNRKDLWEKFDFELDESKHDWYREQPISTYSDTDSVYVVFGDLFKCMTEKYQKKYNDMDKKVRWVVKFSKEFMDKQNKEWLDTLYNPRGGHNVHEFELETVNTAIYQKKKKYLKAVFYNKGKFLKEPKITGTGIELIKSTTPKICRKILKELLDDLLFNCGNMSKEEYVFYFNSLLAQKKKEFYAAPIEDISQSVGIGAYKKYVINDKDELIFAKKAPVSVKAIGRFNYLANKNGEGDKRLTSGKIKYYNIRVGSRSTDIDYFGFPSGELPSWAPEPDKSTQWRKNVIEPINRFLEVMGIPSVNENGTIQLDLFGI
jgi:hypothetical protein